MPSYRLPVLAAGALSLVAIGCASSTPDDAEVSSQNLTACQVDLEARGPATPRARLMSAIHANWYTLGGGPSLESQPNEYVVQHRLTADHEGRVQVRIRVQSCSAGSTTPSCQKRNPAGQMGGPIDWDRLDFPSHFRAKAKRDGGFFFTTWMRTTDCGASFSTNAELMVEGLTDEAMGTPVEYCTTETDGQACDLDGVIGVCRSYPATPGATGADVCETADR